ncbi:uncharacterized protein G2W53_038996 [Senna tora]|uniref:Uncharacterized protein n=1 Tax=Senna tora TaxID=362788 RepID=A0A834SQ09_9FABA|nr:uncharacterized protein G2W53_038996 [Senna tora]
MAPGFGYGIRKSQASYYGNGFYYNGGNFNGLGEDENVYSQPMQVQYQMYYNKPYGVSDQSNGSSWAQVGPNPRVQVGPNPRVQVGPKNYPNSNRNRYYKNTGPQIIRGDVMQRGAFNGRYIGARINGDFFASGDIN